MASGTHHVLDGYEPSGARTLDCGEVHAQLLRLTPGGVRDPRLLGSISPGGLTGGVLRLTRYLSSLISDLTGGVLSLLSRLSGGVLNTLRHLPDLVGYSAQRTSTAAALLLAAASEPAYGVLHTLDGLSGLIGYLTGGVLSLARYLSGLIGCLSHCLLGLSGCLSGSVLHLLRRSLRSLHDLLLGILGGLIHRVLDVHVLGRLIDRALELHVGVDHLLNLGLRVALGDLLRILLQLGAVILDLALDPAYRLPVEVLGVLRGLLLHLLLKIRSLVCHFVSLFLIDSRFR
jgi:hypothetical protein